MKSELATTPFRLGPADVALADVVFASTDVNGTPGELNAYVFSALGYEDPPYPSRQKLRRGYAFIQENGRKPVVLIVTVGTSYSPARALERNLAGAIKMHSKHLIGRTLWIPFMGTGVGDLTNEESLHSTLMAIRNSAIARGKQSTTILLATPPTLSETEVARLRKELTSLMLEAPARKRPPRTNRAKTVSTTTKGPKSKQPPGNKSEPGGPSQPDDSGPDQPPISGDLAPFYPDHPAESDTLGRVAIAETLATIIRQVFKESKEQLATQNEDTDRTFMIHIHGRWGSGKTSILNFLRQELQSEHNKERWVVIDYNAWRNQRNGPAWWSLLTDVYRQALPQVQAWKPDTARKLQLSEWLWRFQSGWAPYIIAFAALLWLGTIMAELSGWNIKDTLTILATAFTIWGGFTTFSRSTRLGAPQTASTFLELSRDPLKPLTSRYEQMIDEIQSPVAVFIDDLDRCEAEFVVDLLQTVQTLFRKAPVAYVVAADRNWVCTSYEKSYADFKKSIVEPGRPLGHLFLEKIFQLSISVPSLSRSLQKEYWDGLLLGRSQQKEIDIQQYRAIQEEQMAKLPSDQDVRNHLGAITNPVERQVAGAVAFRRLQDEDLRKKREHFLQGYANLLDPNPRAMKRLLNAYGFKLGFEMMADVSNPPEALVRWTIIELRWPILAEYLSRYPDQVGTTADGPAPEGIDETLGRLFGKEAVKAVAKDLDGDAIRSLTAAEMPDVEAQAASA